MQILANYPYNAARLTKITTFHGEILTPTFMPVGTKAFVNNMSVDDLLSTKSQIILGGNTYHMLCAPGLEVIQKRGGMHQFMNWQLPMLTDSGGYQVFSLSSHKKICKIDEEGGHFKHPKTGTIINLTPNSSINAQKIIGADIIMAFDECTPERGGREAAMAAMLRTHRWLVACKTIHAQNNLSVYGYPQQLFAIVQGGSFRDLREESAKFISNLDLDGIAIGGEVIGFNLPQTCEIIDWLLPILPPEKTRYAMGVGLNPQDLLDVVAHGIDIFDCVAPTRNARHGALYCGEIVADGHWLKFASSEPNGRILIKKNIYAADERPIVNSCQCLTCCNYTRAYLHHLFKENSALYTNLACIHNVHVMEETCRKMREIIAK